MNAGSMVGISWGDGDTHTLPYAKEFIWTYCTQRWWRCKNFGHKHSHPGKSASAHCQHRHSCLSHMVKLSLPNILNFMVASFCVHTVAFLPQTEWEVENNFGRIRKRKLLEFVPTTKNTEIGNLFALSSLALSITNVYILSADWSNLGHIFIGSQKEH